MSSALIHYLDGLETKLITEKGPQARLKLRLFSDACSSQNKNSIVIACLKRFADRSVLFTEVKHFFPIRGHSFLPPDRVFGRIEKELRRKDNILSPSEYYTFFSRQGNVLQLGKDWMIKDYQQVSKSILKSKLPFPLRDQRVITYTKTNIGVQNVYSAEPDFVQSLLKKGQRYQSMDGAPVRHL